MPTIDYDIVGRRYEWFIERALERSDAVLLVNRKERARVHKAYIPDEMRANIDMVAYQTRLVRQSVINLQRYNDHCLPFLDELKPFLLKVRHNAVWPGTTVGKGGLDEERFDICLYRACAEIKPLLLRPRRLYEWMYPDFPEDPCFFKDNVCWFYTISHEEQAFLHARSEVEVVYWEKKGMTFVDAFDPKWDVERRSTEDY